MVNVLCLVCLLAVILYLIVQCLVSYCSVVCGSIISFLPIYPCSLFCLSNVCKVVNAKRGSLSKLVALKN